MAGLTTEHVWIPMPDGTGLSARIWLPAGAPAPAILEYIPSRKRDMVRGRDARNHPAFQAAGYAAVRVDMRGSGESERLMPEMDTEAERDDTLSVIAWIAAQPWCDGRVGMMGTFWGGTAALQAASRRPPALKAVIAVCATDNRYDDDIHHMGGCLLSDSVEWGAVLLTILASPPDPALCPPDDPGAWRARWRERLEAAAFPLEAWLRHETRDTYSRTGPVREAAGAIACPVLAIGGWADRSSDTVMALLAREGGAVWGIVGPWGHHHPDAASPGPGIDFQGEAIRWWDHWLKGEENGVAEAPRLRAWLTEHQLPEDRIERRAGGWVAPGRAYAVTVPLNACAHRFKAGHRLRLALSTSYWPVIWPAPEAATVTLDLRACTVRLPVREGPGTEPQPPGPRRAFDRLAERQIRDPAARFETNEEPDGTLVMESFDDYGMAENPDHGMIVGSSVTQRFSIRPGDPLSAVHEATWRFEFARGDWTVAIDSTNRMTADATRFHLARSVTAREGDTVIITRDWQDAIPRGVL